ncbi:MAG: cytochrome c-type biogenesis protein [Chloroflexota bacterium]
MPNFYRFRVVGTAVLLLLGLFLLVVPALAQDTVTDDEVNDVAKDLYCPVCENTPLDVCPTQACADWRELIRQQLSDGATPEEVQAYFVRQYGEGVLSNPPKTGFNLILWIFPVAAVVLGGVFFSRYVSSLRASAEGVDEAFEEDVAEASNIPQDDYHARLEAELRNR